MEDTAGKKSIISFWISCIMDNIKFTAVTIGATMKVAGVMLGLF